MQDKRYLQQLSLQYPTANDAAMEIINLSSILNLPKGTEHFITDIHGEYESFLHILKNGSGSIRKKIDEEFKNSLSAKEKKSLATLIYYPEQKLALVEATEEELDDSTIGIRRPSTAWCASTAASHPSTPAPK